MSISNRLFRVLKSVAIDKVDSITQILEEGESLIDEKLREWEKKHGLDQEFDWGGENRRQKYDSNRRQQKTSNFKRNGGVNYGSVYTTQVLDDLKLFGLNPPVTLEEVKKVRNREIKKFHPDHFMDEPEKMETAKRILQIYNAAYERLKKTLNRNTR